MASLASVIDAPLSDRKPFGTVSEPTIFGAAVNGRVHAETNGPFRGWTAWNGIGAWQPVLDLEIRRHAAGTVVKGQAKFRRGFIVTVVFVMISNISLIRGALGDIVQAESVAPGVRWLPALIALALLPSLALAAAWKLGVAERTAVVQRFHDALQSSAELDSSPSRPPAEADLLR